MVVMVVLVLVLVLVLVPVEETKVEEHDTRGEAHQSDSLFRVRRACLREYSSCQPRSSIAFSQLESGSRSCW